MNQESTLKKTNTELFREITEHCLWITGKGIRFQARGHSMFPNILDGDVIEVHPIAISPQNPAIVPGDIMLHRTPANNLVAHRCIRIEKKDSDKELNTVFYMKGDTAFGKGQPIHLTDIYGIVTAVERNGKTIRLQTKSSRMKNRVLAILSPQGVWIYPFYARLTYLAYSLILFLRGIHPEHRNNSQVSVLK
jgi:hypothetical protein